MWSISSIMRWDREVSLSQQARASVILEDIGVARAMSVCPGGRV